MNIRPPLMRAAAAFASLATLWIAFAVLAGCAEADKLWKIDGMTPAEFLEDDKRRRAEGRPTLRQEKEQRAVKGPASTESSVPTVGGHISNGVRTCRKVQATGKADVDNAYIRTMQRFPFRTTDQIDRQYAYYDQTVKHNKTPGVMYDLSDGVVIDGVNGNRVPVEMDLRLAKNGPGCTVSATYCLNSVDNGNSDFIEQKIRALVR
jgi:hypothetical protein